MSGTPSNRKPSSLSSSTSNSLLASTWEYSESLAAIVLQCLQQISTSLEHRSQLRQTAINVFLTSQSNASFVPDPALLEGLLTLCGIPDVVSDAEFCLLLLSASSPSSWEFVTASYSPPLDRHLSVALLNIYIGSPDNENELANVQTVTLLQDSLNRMSNLDFWESRNYLTTTPKTPFSLALKAAIGEYDIRDEAHSEFFQKSRLFALTKSAQLCYWEAVCDDDIQRMIQVWPKHVPIPYSQLLLQRKSTPMPLLGNGLEHSNAILELLCTVPEFAISLTRQLTSTQKVGALTGKIYDGKLSTAAVHTLLKGTSDTTNIYSEEAFSALLALLDCIVVHAGNDGRVDSMLVVNVFDFLLAESRAENGIPENFVPIGKSLFALSRIAAMNDRTVLPKLRKSLKEIIKGRTTSADFRELARNTETDMKRIEHGHDPKDGG